MQPVPRFNGDASRDVASDERRAADGASSDATASDAARADGPEGGKSDGSSNDAANSDPRLDSSAPSDAKNDTNRQSDGAPDTSASDAQSGTTDGTVGIDVVVSIDVGPAADAKRDQKDLPRDAADGGPNPAADAALDNGNTEDATGAMDAKVDVEGCSLNACGGCTPLAAQPGDTCGQCGKYACAPDKESVTCDDPGYVKYKSVAVGAWSTCALTTTGGVRRWGGWDADAIPAPPASTS